MTAATSELPGRGGLDPSVGVDYRYFTEERPREGDVAAEGEGARLDRGMFTARDPAGRERLLATYTRQDGLKPPLECGVARLRGRREISSRGCGCPARRNRTHSSHPILYRDGEREYWYLYPWLRVPERVGGDRRPGAMGAAGGPAAAELRARVVRGVERISEGASCC